ncbi:hypothetical protein EES44_14160 [Streptomyces sp. ADI96-15]|nr:Hypothetical protein B591_28599 [Streptomyces sp. GBA 94-10 4N24]ESQ02011.1 Hypothetical protein B590_28464 [Streptomyces sp. PVA_94-07]RPK65060.1 hypothetical protein EES44_14160 [Streptomyces sp. ADI96-15]UZN62720.1 Hypothetical protein B591N_28599 [Streptomyces sp. GBA 94-10 4N24]
MTGRRNGGRVDVGSVTAVSVAVVGVVGTLLSALLTQRAADRSRQRERERAELARERRGELLEMRTCYVALNTATRQYLAALTDLVHALRRDGSGPVRQRLTEARDQHRDVYAEAQLRVPDPVLDLAGQLSRELGTVYGMVKRLDAAAPREGDSLPGAQERIDALWRLLREMRRRMRAELGVPATAGGRTAEPALPPRAAPRETERGEGGPGTSGTRRGTDG